MKNTNKPPRGLCTAWDRDPKKRKPGPTGFPMRCGKCPTCRTARQDTWVGRCRAESKTAIRTDFVTLTYADEGEAYGFQNKDRARQLFRRDYQNWIRRLRKEGHRIRYVVAGEYGKEKGRAHWHLLLFWYSKPWTPPLATRNIQRQWHPVGSKYNKLRLPEQTHWLHGYVTVEVVTDRRAIQYVTKYITKDASGDTESYFAASQNIGTAWICGQWAQTCVNQGLVPQTFQAFTRYEFAEDRTADKYGKAWQYRMPSGVAAKFANAVREKWETQRTDCWPLSPAFLHYLAKYEKDHLPSLAIPFVPQPVKSRLRIPTDEDIPAYFFHRPSIQYSESHNAHYIDDPDTGDRLWYAPSTIEFGEWDWHVGIKSEKVDRKTV